MHGLNWEAENISNFSEWLNHCEIFKTLGINNFNFSICAEVGFIKPYQKTHNDVGPPKKMTKK